MTSYLKCQLKIAEILSNTIFDRDFSDRHRRSNKDFTRQCSLAFPKLILFQLNMVRSALQDELDCFFSIIMGDTTGLDREIGKSAYCEARKKFSASAHIELNQKACDAFYQLSDYQTWHGHRTLMIDGSTIELPSSKKAEKHYGFLNDQAHQPVPAFLSCMTRLMPSY